jgi:pimeloyl-ACP methyl ester carboxylesterase
METITSKDGTPIAVHRSGGGPPLVLVHGTSGSSARWNAVLPRLGEHFSVYAVDRRGYGESGDGQHYALEREVDDIVTIVDAIGQPAHLLGHSFGALCVLEAALLTRNLRKLILYEPAIPLPGVVLYADGMIDQMQARLDAGDREGVLALLFQEVAQMPPHEFELLRSAPTWPVRLASAHAVPRESRAEAGYTFEAQRFQALQTPTLLLTGGDSPTFLKAATQALASALPDCRVAVMPGQQHIAMSTAPEVFVHEVLTFLTGAS